MSDEQKPKIENLEQQAAELTTAQAEEAQGRVIAVSHSILCSEELRSGAIINSLEF